MSATSTLIDIVTTLAPLAPGINTILSNKGMDWLRKFSDKVNALPTNQKRAAVAGLAAIFTFAKHLFGADLPESVTGYLVEIVQWGVTTLAAFGLHEIKTTDYLTPDQQAALDAAHPEG